MTLAPSILDAPATTDARPLAAHPVVHLGMRIDDTAAGVDRYLGGLHGGLRVLGVDSRVCGFTARRGGPTQSVGECRGRVGCGTDLTSLGCDRAPLPLRLVRLRAVARRLPLDAVIATHFALYAAPLLDRLGRGPHVLHFHGPWADEADREGEPRRKTVLKRRIERAVYHTADRCVVLSEAFRGVLCERYGIDPGIVRTVPGGIDADRFDPGVSRDQARRELGWSGDRPIVLCVRRLVRRMGLMRLLDAVVELRRRHHEVLVLIGGRGPLAEPLRRRVRALGLEGCVRLLGFVPESRLPLAYRAADLSIVPSSGLEGFGLTTLESLAAGTPVLVTPVGGLPEAVEGLDRGLVLTGSDASHLVQGLDHALTHPGRLPDPNACAAYARDNFDWPVIARRVAAVYREISW